MQFFDTLCEVHRGKFLFEKSMKKYMKNLHNINLSHTELICLQYLTHSPGISLYDLARLSGLDIPQLSQIITRMERKKLVEKTIVSEIPLKLSLSLSIPASEACENYRIHMAEKICGALDRQKEIDTINRAIADYHSLVEKLEERFL